VNLLVLLLLLLVWFRGSGVVQDEGVVVETSLSGPGVCLVVEGGHHHCTPTLVGIDFLLPASGTVIHAAVTNGPLPPESQQGYEITIDATGRATIVVTPHRAAESLGDRRTAEPIVSTADLGVDGLQQLLRTLYGASFFFLRTTDEIDPADVPVGGAASSIEVTLADGTWRVSGPGLTPEERSLLDGAQSLVLAAVGLDGVRAGELLVLEEATGRVVARRPVRAPTA
jgi:hypothetical protein